jgi:hypothetical protein
LEFERAVAVMHGSSPWMLGEEDGHSGDLTSRCTGWQSNGCGRTARSGGSDDLSSSESEFLRKRNSRKGGEQMQWQIMRLLRPFTGQRRKGGRYRGGEMVDGEWSSSMLPFRGEERKGQHPFRKGK